MMLPVYIGNICRHRRTAPRKCSPRGFTLVELLVVMFLLLLLASVALPTVRQVLLDQKNARAARSLVSFIDIARSRAIAEGREVGVLFERLSEDASDRVGTSACIRVRQLTGVPPYSGESGDAKATLTRASTTIGGFNWASVPGVNQAEFDAADNQLLAISAALAPSVMAPVRPGFDRLELPGGKIVTIRQISQAGNKVFLRFDLREPSEQSATLLYPRGARRPFSPGQQVKYRIHRTPVRSSTAPLTFPRGVAIDLNYSGVGLTGADFSNYAAPSQTTNIAIIFGPDGRVSRYVDPAGDQHKPVSQLFFCLGDLAGVRPDDLFATDGRDRANIVRNKSSWIVINNQTGRTFAAPFGPVSDATTMSAASVDAKLRQALRESRYLASLSDRVDGN